MFEGGFLGLDNIGVFDRSAPLPTGGRLEQADGTAWMALFSQNMLELALILADTTRATSDMVLKFVEHFFWIAAAIDPIGEHPDEMWDEEDGFFYDVLRLPDGSGPAARRCARWSGCCRCAPPPSSSARLLERYPAPRRAGPDVTSTATTTCSPTSPIPLEPGVNGRRLLSLVNEDKLRRILTRMLDEERFLGPHGIRSLSRWHLDHPYAFERRRHELPGAVRAGRVDDRHVRRQLQLAGAGVVPRQPAHHPCPAAALPVLRRRLHRSSARRGRARDDPVRGGPGARPPAGRHLPARRRTAAGRSTAAPRSSRTIRTGATWSCSTSTSTATTAPGSAPRTRPAGRAWWPASSR